jgi:hypothetical protein
LTVGTRGRFRPAWVGERSSRCIQFGPGPVPEAEPSRCVRFTPPRPSEGEPLPRIQFLTSLVPRRLPQGGSLLRQPGWRREAPPRVGYRTSCRFRTSSRLPHLESASAARVGYRTSSRLSHLVSASAARVGTRSSCRFRASSRLPHLESATAPQVGYRTSFRHPQLVSAPAARVASGPAWFEGRGPRGGLASPGSGSEASTMRSVLSSLGFGGDLRGVLFCSVLARSVPKAGVSRCGWLPSRLVSR